MYDPFAPAKAHAARYYSMPPHVREQVMPHFGETNDQRNARETMEAQKQRLGAIQRGLEREKRK